MLIEFKVANFRSIRDEQTLSLVASPTDTDLPGSVIERDLPGLSGVRFLKGAAIYGANASGKSNVLAALRFVAEFVRSSVVGLRPEEPTGTEPFKLDAASRHQPSEFELTFVVNGVRYVFGLGVTPERVVEEYLVAYPKGTPQRWYAREYDAEKKVYTWARPGSGFKSDKSLQDKTRENALFLSVAPQFNDPQLTPIFEWFRSALRFLHFNEEKPEDRLTTDLLAVPAYRSRIIGLLKSADLGIADTRFQESKSLRELANLRSRLLKMFDSAQMIPQLKEKIPQLQRWEHLSAAEKEEEVKNSIKLSEPEPEIQLLHPGEGDELVALDFKREESNGTRRLFALIGHWLNFLEQGSILLIDEIETSLHPYLVDELLKLAFSPEANPKGAQIIFTTHDALLLDKETMRRDQIWFTEKSPDGVTHLYPLTKYKPRKEEARTTGYLAGRYGGVPFIPEGLQL